MKILITPRMERCIGCHSCSLACARLVHKQLSWDKAGIRIRSTAGLSTGRGQIEEIDGRNSCGGGSGLAALLFSRMGFSDRSWEDPEQPLIFAIGPLTGYFPLMSKVVCAFKSPYHDQYAESQASGRDFLIVDGLISRIFLQDYFS